MRPAVGWGLRLLPWGVLALSGRSLVQGLLLWLNCIITLWNRLHQGGAAATERSALLWSITLAALLLSTFLLPAGEMESVTAFRADVAERIHALRFGKEQLPEGHLDRAALLNWDSGEVLHIHAGQEKTLYLRAYVGAVYEDGVWTLLPDSAYGGDYSGMLEWLGEQDFDPLTQSAAYYALCTGDDLPESSHLTVDVKAGARCYLYLPGSVSSVAGTSPRDIRDARLGARPSSARGFIRRRRPLPPAMWRGMISPPPPSKRAGPRAFPSRDRTPTPGRRSILTARLHPHGDPPPHLSGGPAPASGSRQVHHPGGAPGGGGAGARIARFFGEMMQIFAVFVGKVLEFSAHLCYHDTSTAKGVLAQRRGSQAPGPGNTLRQPALRRFRENGIFPIFPKEPAAAGSFSYLWDMKKKLP